MKNYSCKQKILRNEIALLKLRQNQQESDIRNEFYETVDLLKPSKIITNSLIELYKEPIVKEGILNSSISFISGYISRKVIVGDSNSFIKSTIGYWVEIIVSKLMSKGITNY